jgi:hypothetical protein
LDGWLEVLGTDSQKCIFAGNKAQQTGDKSNRTRAMASEMHVRESDSTSAAEPCIDRALVQHKMAHAHDEEKICSSP